jgi:hypothetical protein
MIVYFGVDGFFSCWQFLKSEDMIEIHLFGSQVIWSFGIARLA